MAQYGLLGRHLGHSYSPAIHHCFGSVPYKLYEKEPDELPGFLQNGSWDGLNVTMPYKKAVIPFCHELSPQAKVLHSVNTLVRRSDGRIYGDNTDAYGFRQMALGLGVDYPGKKALVLGSGGASATVQAILRELGCSVVVISRTGQDNYDNLYRHSDANLLVNTTPVGMYPKNESTPLSLDLFPWLTAVLDLIYNPARTILIQEAERRKIPCASGLHMLVAQAAKASELFTGRTISQEMVDGVRERISQEMENLILIGMPGSGKSTIGQHLAQYLNRTFWDSDTEIERIVGMSAAEYIQKNGEAAFRTVESQVLRRLGALSGAVIATGGGCVTKQENYPPLHQNGRIIWLHRDLSSLPDAHRPLSQTVGIHRLYAARRPLYQTFAQFEVDNNGSPQETIHRILEAIEK